MEAVWTDHLYQINILGMIDQKNQEETLNKYSSRSPLGVMYRNGLLQSPNNKVSRLGASVQMKFRV